MSIRIMGVWESQMRERYDEYLSLFMRLTQKMIKYKNITNFFYSLLPSFTFHVAHFKRENL